MKMHFVFKMNNLLPEKKLLILVDISFYLYRSYYSFPRLVDCNGKSIGAVYGSLKIIKNLLLKYQPTHLAIVFDYERKTFRNLFFKGYKSNRMAMPKDLFDQVVLILELFKFMGFCTYRKQGIEADDIIGTLTKVAENNSYNVLISSGDKDFFQLVSTKTNLIFKRNEVFGLEEVIKKFGLSPNQIVDYLALVGDVTDNVPGVPGIGKKTARILLQRIGNQGIHSIYQKLGKIHSIKIKGSKNIVSRLVKYCDLVFLSYQLVKIKTDVPIQISFIQLEIEWEKFERSNFLSKYFNIYDLMRDFVDFSRKKYDILFPFTF